MPSNVWFQACLKEHVSPDGLYAASSIASTLSVRWLLCPNRGSGTPLHQASIASAVAPASEKLVYLPGYKYQKDSITTLVLLELLHTFSQGIASIGTKVVELPRGVGGNDQVLMLSAFQ